ncbi:UPAR/Ly6 domain-containing protein crok-like [Periplaneta americana]|uniref:UPAR/Ly6 domain-containing protein crok-like n=1 Tax=Periplaneta americana TaxID=6978 RepID=UPI0037E91ACB
MQGASYIAGFCLLAFAVHTGSGLRCWTCSSNSERHCGDPFNKTYISMVDCNRDRSQHYHIQTANVVCKKSKHLVNGEEIVMRSCEWNKDTACTPSHHTAVQNVFCETCSEDGCNGAFRFSTPTILTVLLPAVLWTIAAKIL